MRRPRDLDLSKFECQQCGVCCRVPGFVALEHGEAEKIAEFLGLDIYEFTARYTVLTYSRDQLNLTEQEDGSCIFLQEDNTCRINSVKPVQCRGFPYSWITPVLDRSCPALHEVKERQRGTAQSAEAANAEC